MDLNGKVEVHVPHWIDVVPYGRGPRSRGCPHSENGVWVAHSRAEAVLVCQVLGPDSESLVLYLIKPIEALPN